MCNEDRQTVHKHRKSHNERTRWHIPWRWGGDTWLTLLVGMENGTATWGQFGSSSQYLTQNHHGAQTFPLLATYPKEVKTSTCKNTCTSMSHVYKYLYVNVTCVQILAPVTTVKGSKQSKRPSTDEQITGSISYNGILLSHEKKSSPDYTYKPPQDEPWTHMKWKKTDTTGHRFSDTIFMKWPQQVHRMGQQTGEGVTATRYEVSFGMMTLVENQNVAMAKQLHRYIKTTELLGVGGETRANVSRRSYQA